GGLRPAHVPLGLSRHACRRSLVLRMVCRPPPRSTLFPYTTLFRSCNGPPTPAHIPGWFLRHETPHSFLLMLKQRRSHPFWKAPADRKSTRLNSSHVKISYAVFCLKKKTTRRRDPHALTQWRFA